MRMLLTAALLVAALPMAADAAPTITTTATTGLAKVQILSADVTILHAATRSLDFGIIKASAETQTKTVAAYSGQDDYFTFTKDPSEEVHTHLDSTVSFTGTTMTTMTATLGSFSNQYEAYGRSCDTHGTVNVFGTLTVPAWTKKGDYTGTYNVTVAYQ